MKYLTCASLLVLANVACPAHADQLAATASPQTDAPAAADAPPAQEGTAAKPAGAPAADNQPASRASPTPSPFSPGREFSEPSLAKEEAPAPSAAVPPGTQVLLPSNHLLGDWAGVRTGMEGIGITPTLGFTSDLAWNPSGGRKEGVTSANSLAASLQLDLNKLIGLQNGQVQITGAYRWGPSLSAKYIGNNLAVQQIYGFQTYRLINVAYTQQLFDNLVELKLGRFAAMDDFLVSYYNYSLVSGAFSGNPVGIFFDSPGASTYTGTWAARVKLRPTKDFYVMAGVYNGDQKFRENRYHGVNFSLHGPLFAMAEIGYHVSGFPGNYSIGGWYDRSTQTDFETGAPRKSNGGLYAQFDQVLLPFGPPDTKRGLGIFGSVTLATDPHEQLITQFYTGGIVGRGIFSARPKDTFGLSFAHASFSKYLRRAQRSAQLLDPTVGVSRYESVIEATYRFVINSGAIFLQPDLQYVIKPGAAGQYKNATVVGLQTGINF